MHAVALLECPLSGDCVVDGSLTIFKPLSVNGNLVLNGTLIIQANAFVNVSGSVSIHSRSSAILIQSDNFDLTKELYNSGQLLVFDTLSVFMDGTPAPVMQQLSSLLVFMRDSGFKECRHASVYAFFQPAKGLAAFVSLDEEQCFEVNPVWGKVLAAFLLAALAGLLLYCTVVIYQYFKSRRPAVEAHWQRIESSSDEE